MAPAGPPHDPPDGARRRGPDDADDWDWGGDWDADERPVPRERTDGARGGREPSSPSPPGADDGTPPSDARRPADRRRPTDAQRPADRTPPTDRGGASTDPPVRRGPRAPLAVGVLLVALLLVGFAARAIAGGGEDHDRPVAADDADGGALRALTGLAARAAEDQADRAAALRRYARIGRPIYCGAGRRPWVALTFDDGPGPLSARWITTMAKDGVPMTLFRIGRNVAADAEYVRVQRNLGWDSGSHTQDHPALATLSAADQLRQIREGVASSRRVLGRPPVLFRPPYESHDATTDRIVERLGLVEVLWNVDTQDSLGTTSTDEIVRTAVRGMRPGSIILMHEVKPNTLQAMPRILAALRERGLRPVTVSEMLAGDGPSEAQLRKGYDGCAVDLTPGTAAS